MVWKLLFQEMSTGWQHFSVPLLDSWGSQWAVLNRSTVSDSFKKIFFIFTLFCFTILYWFCHTLTWISHGCTWVPNPEPPSHFLPHIISLDHPCAPAPSILYPVSNIDWRFGSYMIVYMFQCHSPKSSLSHRCTEWTFFFFNHHATSYNLLYPFQLLMYSSTYLEECFCEDISLLNFKSRLCPWVHCSIVYNNQDMETT